MNKIILEDFKQIALENLDWGYLSNKNILVSGANGMIASYFIEAILFLNNVGLIQNVNIFALVRNKDKSDVRFKDYINKKNFNFIVQDVCVPIEINSKIDIIIHAASQASPKYYKNDPIGTIEPNISGTTNLLKLAKEKKSKCFLFFSSAEVYGSYKDSEAINEDYFGSLNPMDIRSCYAESKRMGENICASWHSQHNIPIKIIRPFHTYGPGMFIDDGRIFADFVFNIVNNQNVVIKSDGSARRAYCYLKDAIIAYFYILIKGRVGEAYNVGNPYQEYTVKELADILVRLFPERSLKVDINPFFTSPSYLPSKVNRFLPDTSKIEALGWTPTVDVITGFKNTILSYS